MRKLIIGLGILLQIILCAGLKMPFTQATNPFNTLEYKEIKGYFVNEMVQLEPTTFLIIDNKTAWDYHFSAFPTGSKNVTPLTKDDFKKHIAIAIIKTDKVKWQMLTQSAYLSDKKVNNLVIAYTAHTNHAKVQWLAKSPHILLIPKGFYNRFTFIENGEEVGNLHFDNPYGAPIQNASSEPAINIVKSNNNFAFDLYNQLDNNDNNLFFSPISISTALAMTYTAAQNKTEKQLATILHNQHEQMNYHQAFGKLLSNFNSKQDSVKNQTALYDLALANGFWVNPEFPLHEEFSENIQQTYQSEVANLDFNKKRKAARSINTWIAKQTKGFIKDIISHRDLEARPPAILTNTIYFKGSWLNEFEKSETDKDKFHVNAEKSVKVPMMHQTESVNYFENEAFQMVQLPYKGKISMIALLPKAMKINDLKQLEKQLNSDKYNNWQSQMQHQKVAISLPRFAFEQNTTLKQPLTALGLTDAFDAQTADFSLMSNAKIFLNKIIHKARIELDEKGTTAAATTVALPLSTSMFVEEDIKTFNANHPFIFLIQDDETGSILFMGRVMRP